MDLLLHFQLRLGVFLFYSRMAIKQFSFFFQLHRLIYVIVIHLNISSYRTVNILFLFFNESIENRLVLILTPIQALSNPVVVCWVMGLYILVQIY